MEPKCIADRGKGAGDKFMRKEEKKGKGGAKKGEQEEPSKPATGLARELNLLEERLKAQHLAMDKADKADDPKRNPERVASAGRGKRERQEVARHGAAGSPHAGRAFCFPQRRHHPPNHMRHVAA